MAPAAASLALRAHPVDALPGHDVLRGRGGPLRAGGLSGQAAGSVQHPLATESGEPAAPARRRHALDARSRIGQAGAPGPNQRGHGGPPDDPHRMAAA